MKRERARDVSAYLSISDISLVQLATGKLDIERSEMQDLSEAKAR